MTETNVFDPVAHPDLASVHDRTGVRPLIERVYFSESSFAQGADFNEAFTREGNRRKAIGDLIAKDGDRLAGADIIVNSGAGTVTVSDGILYLIGAPRAVDAAVLTGVPMVGDVEIGVRIVETPVTAIDDTIYLGLVEGTESYGEEGAIRTTLDIQWAFDTDGGTGDFYRYVLLRDGQVVSQDAPPTLSGVQRQIASYDFGAHGNYIVKGCEVQALGLNGTKRIFSVGAGETNINGFKVIRTTDSRVEIEEVPDLGTVDAEPHIFETAGTTTIVVRHPPIAAVNTVIVTKEKTVTLTKGVAGSADALPDTGVTSIIEVKQGGTTYAATTDYVRVGDTVSWAPAGAEPATGSSYTVKYRYLDAIIPDSFTAMTITLTGGVTGESVILGYTYKLPRHDRLCLAEDGSFVYLDGVSSPTHPHPPAEPSNVLSLCVVKNDWFGAPVISNDGTRAMTFKALNRMYDRLTDAINLVTIERLKSSAISRAPGMTLGVFTDPFADDEYRDLGEPQDAASFEGSLQIGIDSTFTAVRLTEVGMLNYTSEIIVSQNAATGCVKINPYQNFTPLPASLTIEPSRDFWTEVEEVTLSEQTRVIGRGNSQRVKSERTVTKTKAEPIRTLRQIDIDFRIDGFGSGEALTALTFDGLDVNPGGLVADANGVITGTFTIPAGVASGAKIVAGQGGSGAECFASFRGQGMIETTINRDVTIIERFRDDPPVPRRFSGSPGATGSVDPQAQSFVLQRGRHISSIALKFCLIGNRANNVIVDIVAVGDQGIPTQQVIASALIDMDTVIANTWTIVNFEVPVYQPADTYLAFVVKTNDANHSISIASVGDFDADTQKWVTAQPYIAGDRFSGSNSLSWLLHPESDITNRIYGCRFTETTKTIAVGTFAVTNVSDIMILASVILPEAATSVVFEIEIGTTVHRVLPGQNLELDAFHTGNITVRAVLAGTVFASPILAQDILLVLGTMRASGTYIGRSFTMGNPVRVDAYMSTWLPGGSALTVEVDANNDVWTAMPLVDANAIDDGFVEHTYRKTGHSAADGGRVKITLTGTPAARPAIADLRMFTM